MGGPLRRQPSLNVALILAVSGLLRPVAPSPNLQLGNRTHGWVEIISWRPRALLFHGFLTDAECDHVIQLAKPNLQPSKVVSADGTGRLEDSVRTSSGTFLRKQQDEVLTAIEGRIELATHLPFNHSEQLQVLKYEQGQKYKAHYDVHGSNEQAQLVMRRGEKGGSRYATLLMYLSDVDEGGETSFPHGRWIDKDAQAQLPYSQCGSVGVAIKPRKGDAILFYSLKPDGMTKDFFSLHAGCPVAKGVKYSATAWIHVEPYTSAAPLHPGFCRDTNAKCPEWAAAGECERNSLYMRGNGTYRGYCRLSCKVCRPCALDDLPCLMSNLTPAERTAHAAQQ